MFENYQVVELAEEMSPLLKPGTRGTILMIYPSQPPEYEVEFVDDDGATIAVLTVSEARLRRISDAAEPKEDK